MKIPPLRIKTLDGDDTGAEREYRELNFELHSDAVRQNFCLQKTDRIVQQSKISDQSLRRNPKTKITTLINFCRLYLIIFIIFTNLVEASLSVNRSKQNGVFWS